MAFSIPEKNLHVNCTLEDYRYYKNFPERHLQLFGSIVSIDDDDLYEGSMISALVESILEYNREDKDIEPSKRKPIYLYINSPGGDVIEGFSLVSVMELSKTPIYTINIGEWASMSFLIGIAGHKRFSLPNMTFLMHDGSSYAFGSTNKVQDQVEFNKRFDERVIKAHVLKHSNMKGTDYDALARVELYMLPEDALERGFIDEIITDIDTIL